MKEKLYNAQEFSTKENLYGKFQEIGQICIYAARVMLQEFMAQFITIFQVRNS